MPSDFQFKIDTSQFNAMCHDLSRVSGHDVAPVLDYEVARVIEKTVAYLPAASVSKIRARYDGAEMSTQPDMLYTPTSSSGRRGRAAADHGGKIKYWLGNRYPDELWARIVAARKLALQRKLKARGLAKHSFYLIAQALGLVIRTPGFVKTAVASTGKEYPEDITTRRVVDANGAGMFIENAQPTVNAIGGGRALQRAIDGRVGFFLQNAKHKVFESVAAVARKYPGVTIK